MWYYTDRAIVVLVPIWALIAAAVCWGLEWNGPCWAIVLVTAGYILGVLHCKQMR